MKKLKTLGTLLLAGLGYNSYCQDTIKTADGYTIKNEKYIIKDVVKKEKGEDVYEYNDGKLKTLTTFSEGVKTRLYNYNEKGQLITETIFDEKGKSKKVINRELEK
ncbi:hypothetical protein HYT91_02980 [Candidatus Pacearchaeota archaeon]|nr:hypothetical protein [Candidatus Pacearchaeota archaeon]